jgi:hypothetical protein
MVAISVLYDRFMLESGAKAKDIGVGLGGSGDDFTWIIGDTLIPGTNDFPIYQRRRNPDYTTLGWGRADGGAVRIAVGADARPWIVNSRGEIYRRTEGLWDVGAWERLPGLASDIGVGGTSTWIIGWNGQPGTDNPIYKWNGSGWTQSNASGTRISVGADGIPWFIKANRTIWRRDSASVTSGSWQQLPDRLGTDIGARSGKYAWVIGTNFDSVGNASIYVWNEQAAFVSGTTGAPARRGWLQYTPDKARTIASANLDGAWVVTAAGDIFRPEEGGRVR